jgi:hypothetical protein
MRARLDPTSAARGPTALGRWRGTRTNGPRQARSRHPPPSRLTMPQRASDRRRSARTRSAADQCGAFLGTGVHCRRGRVRREDPAPALPLICQRQPWPPSPCLSSTQEPACEWTRGHPSDPRVAHTAAGHRPRLRHTPFARPSDASNSASHSLLTRTRACAGLVHAPGVLLPFRYRGAPPDGTGSPQNPRCLQRGFTDA